MIVFSETRAFKSRHGRSNKGKLNFFIAFSPTLPTRDSPKNHRIFSYLTSIWTTKQNNNPLCEVFVNKFAHFHLNRRYNYYKTSRAQQTLGKVKNS